MEIHLSRPEDVSRNLGIQTSILRKYVHYFPHLFSAYARSEYNSRYTVEDVWVLRRIRRLGDRISVAIPFKVKNRSPVELMQYDRDIATVSEDLDRVFIYICRKAVT